MQVYRFMWGLLAIVVVTPAVGWAVGAGAGVEMLVLGAGFALFTGTFVGVVLEDQPARWQWVRRSVLWAGLGAPGADAVSATWGTAGSVLAMVLVLTAPALIGPAYTLYAGWSSSRTVGPPESLSPRDLRRRWHSTTDEVRHPATSPSRRLMLLEERRALLDELQRRDPVEFDSVSCRRLAGPRA